MSHRVLGREICLVRLNQILAFIFGLAWQIDGMFEET